MAQASGAVGVSPGRAVCYHRGMAERDSAICLRTADWSETSQVVHFLTRGHGPVRVVAKGSKRSKSKSGGAIDILSEGDLVFLPSSRESLGTLTEFQETVSHTPLRRSAPTLNAALYLIELASALIAEGDPHPEVFDLLHNSLARLASEDAPVAAVVAYFQWRLLRRVGLLGDMGACVSCGGEIGGAELFFSSRQGGLLCGDCAGQAPEKYRLDANARAAIATLQALEARRRVEFPAPQARAANRLLAYHVTEQLGRPPRMARYVLEEPGGTGGQEQGTP